MGGELPRNDLFRVARERLPSPSGAPRSMSRQELADAINAYLYREQGREERLNQDDIGRIERGRTRWPGQWRRLGCRAILGAASDAELGFWFHRTAPEQPDEMNSVAEPARAVFGQHSSTEEFSPDTALGWGEANGQFQPFVASCAEEVAPSSTGVQHQADELRGRLLNAAAVDKRAVELLAVQSDHIREVDRRLGARVAEAQMRGHLAALDQLRTFTVLAHQRQPLADLYADAATLAGWQRLDLGDLEASWRHHEAAKSAGHEGSTSAGLAHAIAQQAYVLVELGELASAIQMAEYARSVAGTGVPPLLLVWLWAVQGELHALSGDAAACRRAYETAEHLLPSDAHDPELPYIVLSDIHLARWRGNSLAQLGDPTAIDDLRRALHSLDQSFTRARAGMHVDLASALLAAGHRTEATTELHQAKTLAVRVGSTRQRRRVRRLESALQTA